VTIEGHFCDLLTVAIFCAQLTVAQYVSDSLSFFFKSKQKMLKLTLALADFESQ